MRFREQWPAVSVYAVAVIYILVVYAFAWGAPTFCEPAEKETLIVCLRNWTNASGNVFTFGGALLAAAFAYGQWRAATAQAGLASLPVIGERLTALREGVKLSTEASFRINQCISDIGFMIREIQRKPTEDIAKFLRYLNSLEIAAYQLLSTGESILKLHDASDDPLLKSVSFEAYTVCNVIFSEIHDQITFVISNYRDVEGKTIVTDAVIGFIEELKADDDFKTLFTSVRQRQPSMMILEGQFRRLVQKLEHRRHEIIINHL